MCFVWAEHCLRLNASEFRARYRLDYESFNAPLLETKPPAPLASFLAAAHACIIAAEGSAALSRGSRGPRERAKVLLSPPIYPLLLHALHHSSVSASSPLSPRETHHKSYTCRIKHAGTRAPGTPSFAMGAGGVDCPGVGVPGCVRSVPDFSPPQAKIFFEERILRKF